MSTSLSQSFIENVLQRDNRRCVICGSAPAALHFIIDPSLFPEGGQHLDNAAALCSDHRTLALQTRLSCDEIRDAAKIRTLLLPEHLSTENGENYDVWGNPFYKNGRKYRGELWWDEPCQSALASAGLLGDFTPYVHYPRTMHLPWSPNLQNDDRRIENLNAFIGQEVVVTRKMDGESATLYRNYYHARSLDSRHHPSRAWIKAFHSQIAHEIPEDWRLCGENLFAQHSIRYEELESYFYLFNIWERNHRLSWDDTVEYAKIMGLTLVPVLYRGLWNEAELHRIEDQLDSVTDEGYVVSVTRSFRISEWRRCAAKYVRAAHVRTSQHWMFQEIVPNKLKTTLAP